MDDNMPHDATNTMSEAVPMSTDIDPLSLPPHGTEVFVGSLNRSATEDEIRDFASQAGEVFNVKLMRDPSNSNASRGFGFVAYTTRESALRAMDHLHGKEMERYPGNEIRVQPSQSKNRLFVGGLPHTLSKEQLGKYLEKDLGLKGLLSIDLALNRDNPEENRGFTFLEFYNSACALQAKSKLNAPDVRIGDRQINVDLAEPMGQEASMAQATKTIFVGNLPSVVTEDQLKNAFAKYGTVDKINLPRPKTEGDDQPRYGFVLFTERVAALHAVEDTEKPQIEGIELAVKYGKADGPHGGTGLGGIGGGFGGRSGSIGSRGGGRFGAYQNRYPPQQQQYHQQQQQQMFPPQQQYGVNGGGGYMMGNMGGMVPMVPVQLPNGQVGYMLQAGAAMGDGMSNFRGRGGYRGGYSGRGGSGRGGSSPYSQRFQPY